MKITKAKRVVDNYVSVTLSDGRVGTVTDDSKDLADWVADGNAITEVPTAHKIGLARSQKILEIKNYAQSLVDSVESDIEVELRRARMDHYLFQIADGNALPASAVDNRATVVIILQIYQVARQAIYDVRALQTIEEIILVNTTALPWPEIPV